MNHANEVRRPRRAPTSCSPSLFPWRREWPNCTKWREERRAGGERVFCRRAPDLPTRARPVLQWESPSPSRHKGLCRDGKFTVVGFCLHIKFENVLPQVLRYGPTTNVSYSVTLSSRLAAWIRISFPIQNALHVFAENPRWLINKRESDFPFSHQRNVTFTRKQRKMMVTPFWNGAVAEFLRIQPWYWPLSS